MPGRTKKFPIRKGDMYETGTNYPRMPKKKNRRVPRYAPRKTRNL